MQMRSNVQMQYSCMLVCFELVHFSEVHSCPNMSSWSRSMLKMLSLSFWNLEPARFPSRGLGNNSIIEQYDSFSCYSIKTWKVMFCMLLSLHSTTKISKVFSCKNLWIHWIFYLSALISLFAGFCKQLLHRFTDIVKGAFSSSSFF